jgi:hypothetical protein
MNPDNKIMLGLAAGRLLENEDFKLVSAQLEADLQAEFMATPFSDQNAVNLLMAKKEGLTKALDKIKWHKGQMDYAIALRDREMSENESDTE